MRRLCFHLLGLLALWIFAQPGLAGAWQRPAGHEDNPRPLTQ